VVAREVNPREAQAMSMGASPEGFAETHAFVLDGEHMPREVEGSEGAVAARFAPNGRDVLVATTESGQRLPLLRADLKRVSPSGEQEDLGTIQLALRGRNFVSGPWGVAWVDQDGDVVYEDPHGKQTHLTPPQPHWLPENIWLGPGTLAVAHRLLRPSYRNEWDRDAAAQLTVFDLATWSSEVVATLELPQTGHIYYKPFAIVGYDPTLPALVLYRGAKRGRYDQVGPMEIIQKRDGVWLPPTPLALR